MAEHRLEGIGLRVVQVGFEVIGDLRPRIGAHVGVELFADATIHVDPPLQAILQGQVDGDHLADGDRVQLAEKGGELAGDGIQHVRVVDGLEQVVPQRHPGDHGIADECLADRSRTQVVIDGVRDVEGDVRADARQDGRFPAQRPEGGRNLGKAKDQGLVHDEDVVVLPFAVEVGRTDRQVRVGSPDACRVGLYPVRV